MRRVEKLIVKLEAFKMGFKIACDIPTGIDVDGKPFFPMGFYCRCYNNYGSF